MPSVVHSAWKAEDGTLGLVFTNIDTSAHTVNYTVDTQYYQLPAAGQYDVTVLAGAGVGTVANYGTSSFARVETLPARSVLVLEVKVHDN